MKSWEGSAALVLCQWRSFLDHMTIREWSRLGESPWPEKKIQ